MERDMSQTFCRCGCGFYGNPATDGMCSKCYKDAIQKKNRDGMVAPPQTSSTTQSTNISSQISNAISNSLNESDASTMVALAAALNLPEKNLEQKIEKETFKEEIDKSKLVNLDDNVTKPVETDVIETKVETTAEQAKTQKKKKPRCAFCNVKLPGCVDYPCRCGGIFCVKHRYDKEHNCTFDYREHGAQEIRKNNPQIVGEKIQKI